MHGGVWIPDFGLDEQRRMTSRGVTARELVGTQINFLLFRPVRIAVREHFWSWAVFVFVITWVVGVGRYWDHPSAATWQYVGLGSVGYILILSCLIYLVVWPLRPETWDYRGVLIFVGLTSLPAVLYAVPVEKFFDLATAQQINAWFLGVVAVWRVALFVRFLLTSARLHWLVATTVVLLLLSGIVVTLSLLNLEHVVFDLMAGIRPENASPHDTAYLIVLGLAFFSLYAFPVALIAYLAAIVHRLRQRHDTVRS